MSNQKYLIALDAGHGAKTAGKRTPKFKDGTFMHEWEFNNAVVQLMTPILKQKGFDVLNVAPTDNDVPLATRTGLANNTIKNSFNRPADFYLSIHANASGDGINFNSGKGIESFIHTNSAIGSKAEQWAKIIQENLVSTLNGINRGVKRGDFHVLRVTSMNACLVECGFMTNEAEAKLLMSADYRNKCATALVNAICKIFNITNVAPIPIGKPIIAKPTATVEQLKQWAKNKGAKAFFVDIAPIFCEACAKVGINPTVAYCQSAKETAYGKFGGVINETYCNPCGMKNSQGGGDYDASAHKKFSTWEQGVSAQVDHLALYAGAHGYPKTLTDDPRHFSYLLGTAKTVEQLSGKWAPSLTYGEEVLKMMKEAESVVTAPPKVDVEPVDTTKVIFDGKKIVVERILKDNTNYIKLRDLEKFGFTVTYSEEFQMPIITGGAK